MKKFLKYLGIAFLVLWLIVFGAMHYINSQFAMSDQEASMAFDSLSVVPKIKDITIDDHSLHIVHLENGNDSLIVFIHGSPGSWSNFGDYFFADSLFDQYDLLAMDRRGFGGSTGSSFVLLQKEAQFLNDFLSGFEADYKVLVGHSLGGPIAAQLVMEAPVAYQKLVLLAASIDPNLEKKEGYRQWMDTSLGEWILPRDVTSSNRELMPLQQELIKMQKLWDRVQIPTVVVHGTNDWLVPKENADFAKKMLPDAILTVYILEGANHFIPWTHPVQVMQAITGELGQ